MWLQSPLVTNNILFINDDDNTTNNFLLNSKKIINKKKIIIIIKTFLVKQRPVNICIYLKGLVNMFLNEEM